MKKRAWVYRGKGPVAFKRLMGLGKQWPGGEKTLLKELHPFLNVRPQQSRGIPPTVSVRTNRNINPPPTQASRTWEPQLPHDIL